MPCQVRSRKMGGMSSRAIATEVIRPAASLIPEPGLWDERPLPCSSRTNWWDRTATNGELRGYSRSANKRTCSGPDCNRQCVLRQKGPFRVVRQAGHFLDRPSPRGITLLVDKTEPPARSHAVSMLYRGKQGVLLDLLCTDRPVLAQDLFISGSRIRFASFTFWSTGWVG
jgi:hypothetical protein